MNYLNFCLIILQIYFIYKYLKKLKDTDERLQDNIQDYYELKLQNSKLECYIKALDDEIQELKKHKCLHN